MPKAKTIVINHQVVLLTTVCGDICNEPFVSSGNVSATDTFLQSFEKTYDRPADVVAVLTYNAMQEVFSAMQKNGGFDRAGLFQGGEK